MWLKQISIGSFIVISLLNFATAQTKTWTFEDGMCIYKGYYNSKKYNEKQLTDTYALFRNGHFVHDRGTLEELIARYDSVMLSIENLQVVQDTYFQQLKEDVLRYQRGTFDLKKVQKKAREEPKYLISAVKSGTKARKYAEALHKGGDDLLEAYEHVIKEQMKNNGTPDYLWHNYENTMKRADRLDLAFDYVLLYGWWNSANQTLPHINYDGTQMEQFQKLFVKVDTIDCDEP